MDSVSVSKGVFAHKGSYTIGQRKTKANGHPSADEPWYIAYKKAWSMIENAAEEINSNMFKQILLDLKNYVSSIKSSSLDNYSNEISTAILLTGVNLPDHEVLFQNLTTKFQEVTDHIAIVQSRVSGNMKSLIEETVYRFVNRQEEGEKPEFRKSQCTLRALESWYRENCTAGDPLVIIVPDFESFNPGVLRDFILILSVYTESIKFVLIFGVATTLHAVHRCLSYDVTSKLRVQVFHTQTQVKSLSDVLEGTVLSGKTPFKLTGRAFQLLTDIFLFCDFAVHGFLEGYKLCMLQHFYNDNVMALCCERKDIKDRVAGLSEDDTKEIRKLPSVAKYMEKIHKDDEELKDLLLTLLEQFHDSMNRFFVILKCLHCLTATMPGAPLGKELRMVYATAVTTDIAETQEYKESMQLLGFLSKEEFVDKLEKFLAIVKDAKLDGLKDVEVNIARDLIVLQNASLEIETDSKETVSVDEKLSRAQLKEKLLKMSQKQTRSPYKQAQADVIRYIDREVFASHLINPNRLPVNEIFCFSDANAVRRSIRGSHRAAIDVALTNPQLYLECDCCHLENEKSIPATLPDLSIIYKLHLESGKLINMYDWLQAFASIINPNHEDEEDKDIDPQIQSRFTHAVAELQFLGFIKTSKKKTDHVKRLT